MGSIRARSAAVSAALVGAAAAFWVVVDPRRGDRAALGRAVALQDDDAQVLPALLQRGRQICTGADHQRQRAAELLVNPRENPPSSPVGKMPSDAPRSIER